MREKVDDLIQTAKYDPYYQQCLEKVQDLEPLYLALRDALPERQKTLLEKYISACEELDHALLLLALKKNNE